MASARVGSRDYQPRCSSTATPPTPAPLPRCCSASTSGSSSRSRSSSSRAQLMSGSPRALALAPARGRPFLPPRACHTRWHRGTPTPDTDADSHTRYRLQYLNAIRMLYYYTAVPVLCIDLVPYCSFIVFESACAAVPSGTRVLVLLDLSGSLIRAPPVGVY